MLLQSATIFQDALFHVFFLGWAFTILAFHFYRSITVSIYYLKSFPRVFRIQDEASCEKKLSDSQENWVLDSWGDRDSVRACQGCSCNHGRRKNNCRQISISSKYPAMPDQPASQQIQNTNSIFCYSSTLENKDCSKKISDPPLQVQWRAWQIRLLEKNNINIPT